MSLKRSLIRGVVIAFTGLGSAAVALVLLGGILFTVVDTQYQRDLGTKETVMHLVDTGVILYDRNDQPFFRFYDAQYRTIVPLSEISPLIVQALIASEDEGFYHHHGYSSKAIVRAMWQNWRSNGIVSGGSTITQQLARTLYLSQEQTYWRKFQELMIARQLERQFGKDDILELYLNTAYYGAGTYGIEAAAQGHFNIPAKDLNLAQASLLVGVLQAPSLLSPITGGAEAAKTEQQEVLGRMVEVGTITDDEGRAAADEELTYSSLDEVPLYPSRAPHFAFVALEQLKAVYGEERLKTSGFHVKTTLDPAWQEKTETAVREQVEKLRRLGANNGGAIALEPKTGEIRAMVGSTDWNGENAGKFNVVTAHRQPGSSFKPIVYAAAIEAGVITAATPLSDRPITYPAPLGGKPYRPRNFDGTFRGTVVARRALANSLNVPAVQVMNLLGVDRALDAAKRFGYTSLEDRNRFGLALALGSGEVSLLEHAGAYAVLANSGERMPPTTIVDVRTGSGQAADWPKANPERVVSTETAYIVTSMLSDQATRREVFGRSLELSRTAAVKTGTSQDYIDAWTMGFTPDVVVGVWVGHNDATPMARVAGISGAAPIWKSLMESFMNKDVAWFEPPSTIARVDVCRSNGGKATFKGGSVYSEFFKPGSEPTGKCVLPKLEENKEEDQSEGEAEVANTDDSDELEEQSEE